MPDRIGSRLQEVIARKPSWLKRPDENEQVWILDTPGLFRRGSVKEVDALKTDILSILFRTGQALLVTPDIDDLPAEWERLGENTVRVPDSVDLTDEEITNVLFSLGNWGAYIAAKAFPGDWPDPFRSEPRVLRAWMGARGMEALIVSWPDDTSWVIALTPDRAEGR